MKAASRPQLRILILAAGLLAASSVASASAVKGDRALGEYLSSECVTCHQKSGKVVGGVPAIVGWPEEQFLAVMHSYQKGDRENPIMRTIAGQFKDEELAALAAYFGSLKPQK